MNDERRVVPTCPICKVILDGSGVERYIGNDKVLVHEWCWTDWCRENEVDVE